MSQRYRVCIFPLPSGYGSTSTKDGYQKNYTMRLTIFHESDSKALEKADELADSLWKKKSFLTLRNQDGSPSSEKLYFTRIQTEGETNGFGTAQLNLQFEVQKQFE